MYMGLRLTGIMRKNAFTLVEILVTTSIIAMLLSVMMPSLSTARKQAHGIVCMNNIKQMLIAANVYANNYDNFFPPAYVRTKIDGIGKTDCWDFMASNNGIVKPGILWQSQGNDKIQQCPSYKGTANWANKYTGYNYNSSYIGGTFKIAVMGTAVVARDAVPSAKLNSLRKPAATAIFGDGRFSGGANKFMRAPFAGTIDIADGFSGSYGGTQDYRHLGKTSVGFGDGHVLGQKNGYNPLPQPWYRNVVKGTGFLSNDNSAYDLE